MLVKELAAIIHQNAVDHGWWDEPRELPEVVALIHSEWSEALEEARAGRPLAYIVVSDGWQGNPHESIIERGQDGKYSICGKEYHGKPEGVAVELIDGCIRILDVIGYQKADVLDPHTGEPTRFEELMGKHQAVPLEDMPEDVATLIAWLHAFTSEAILEDGNTAERLVHLVGAMSLAVSWVQAQGVDPLVLLLEKHEYNKGRPYKHGKKF
jgi:hypothetical protein